MNNMTTPLDSIVVALKKTFSKEKNIISLYLYGSILTKRFNPRKSDIDILIVAREINSPFSFITKLKQKSSAVQGIKLDVNIVFISEFKRRWHIYRPPTYFLGIKHQHRLIFGKDVISAINEKEISAEQVYKRVVDLAQGSRGVYLNNKDPKFWTKKYGKWLQIAALEVLFLTGEVDLSFNSGITKLIKKYRGLSDLRSLDSPNLNIGKINQLAELLRVFTYQHFIKTKKKQ